MYSCISSLVLMAHTALFEKVYRAIFQHKRRRLIFLTGFIIYIQKDTYKNWSKIYIHIFVFVIKLEHDMNTFFLNSIMTDETALAATFG